jgi:hypothetical protein
MNREVHFGLSRQAIITDGTPFIWKSSAETM